MNDFFPQVPFAVHCQSISYDNSVKLQRGASGIVEWLRVHAPLAERPISLQEHS